MCGRMVLTRSAAEIAEVFELARAMAWSPRFNIAPRQSVCAIRIAAAGEQSTSPGVRRSERARLHSMTIVARTRLQPGARLAPSFP